MSIRPFPDWKQINRMGASIDRAPAILTAINCAEARAKLVKAAERGLPPVSVVPDLLSESDRRLLDQDHVRRWIGMAVAGVLADAGWEVDRRGSRVSGKGPFKTGATYKQPQVSAPSSPSPSDQDGGQRVDDGLLTRMIMGMSVEDRRALVTQIEATL